MLVKDVIMQCKIIPNDVKRKYKIRYESELKAVVIGKPSYINLPIKNIKSIKECESCYDIELDQLSISIFKGIFFTHTTIYDYERGKPL